MRKRILSLLSLFTVIMLVTSCGAQKKGASGTNNGSSSASVTGPSASQWRSGVKGTWVLNSVTRQDIPDAYTIKNIFDEAPVECFIGSVWHLPAGAMRNQTGSITFNASGKLCANGAVRTIVWSIYDPGKMGGEPEFQFKKLYAGDKAANVKNGYALGLSFADEQSLVLKMPIPLENGARGHLVFNFSKQAN
ncbi:MAG: hypothetical protein LBE37_15515 [Sphingobacterium sp.]|jgi:hypothetical protein|nr:hypothetical protein [Sphingobacterium sp.]